MVFKSLLLAAAATALVACSSTPMPTEDFAVAEEAVQRAERAGAAEFAAAELATARDKLERARSGVRSETLDADEVEDLVEAAAADAHLAEALAQAGKAEAMARETEENLRALQVEAERAVDAANR
jgi:Domain of unknown function (DUF4398)